MDKSKKEPSFIKITKKTALENKEKWIEEGKKYLYPCTANKMQKWEKLVNELIENDSFYDIIPTVLEVLKVMYEKQETFIEHSKKVIAFMEQKSVEAGVSMDMLLHTVAEFGRDGDLIFSNYYITHNPKHFESIMTKDWFRTLTQENMTREENLTEEEKPE